MDERGGSPTIPACRCTTRMGVGVIPLCSYLFFLLCLYLIRWAPELLRFCFLLSFVVCGRLSHLAFVIWRYAIMSNSIILVVGSINMDEVVQVSRLPVLGETVLGAGSLKLVPGGKGANQAVAMARLGAPVAMAGRVGTDPFGAQLVNALRADKIDTGLIVTDQQEAS